MNNDAWWISPSFKIKAVRLNHINEVWDNPTAFGLTEEYLKEIYDNFGDEYRVEGKAREQIIIELVLKGWVRIRYYNNKNGYLVIMIKHNSAFYAEFFSVLANWLRELKTVAIDRYIPIRILFTEQNIENNDYDLTDLCNRKHLAIFESVNEPEVTIKLHSVTMF